MVSRRSRKAVREKKYWRMCSHLGGTAQRPRLFVFRSNSHMYARVIGDTIGRTLVAVPTLKKETKSVLERADIVEATAYIGKFIAERAKEQDISAVAFDRGGFLYTCLLYTPLSP